MNVEVSVLQLIAYVALTMASVTITAVSALFGYRQNFGWKPVLLVTGQGLSGEGNKDQHSASVQFEIWNRRKYPVALRFINVQFENLELIKVHHVRVMDGLEWQPYRDGWTFRPDSRLEPAQHLSFRVEQPFRAASLDSLRGKISIEMVFTDPVKARGVTLKAATDYRFDFDPTKKPWYMRLIGK